MLLSVDSLAQRVQIPLQLDHHFIESLLRKQVFTGAGDSVRLNDDGSGCQYLQLSEPRVSASGGLVRLQTIAQARAGAVLGGRCMLVLNWRGRLELIQEPMVGKDRKSLLLRTSSWRALDPNGDTATVSTTVGQWLEQFLPYDLKQTQIGFARPIDELREFLGLVLTRGDAARTRAILDSVAIDKVSAERDHATVTLGIDVPALAAPEGPAESVLSPEELAGLEQRLDNVDSFFTYAIKSVGRGSGEGDSAPLLDVLVELRRELITILAEPQAEGDDPAQTLFVNAWEGLAPVVQIIAERQPDQEQSLRFLTFIGAGDALGALNRLGPAAGVEVSSDGLRRLARILIPDDTDDPLYRGDDVDPELRKSFGFGPPLPPPQVLDDASYNPPFSSGSVFHTASFGRGSWFDWFIPPALASGTLDPASVRRLNSWVPKSRDMNVYLPMVRDVLGYVVVEQLRSNELESEFHRVFRWLVLAAAWQETCWRQFVAENDKRVPMRSGTGDIGMMQINPKVWRGFYDLQGLRWDMVYNARAGADILQHHMINYGILKGEHRATGTVDSLARSAYAAYNGGPRQHDRYRRANATARGKKIDGLFFEKYLQIKSGKELAVATCF